MLDTMIVMREMAVSSWAKATVQGKKEVRKLFYWDRLYWSSVGISVIYFTAETLKLNNGKGM